MDIAFIETDALLDELHNRFAAFAFAGLYRGEDEPDDASVYIFHGGAVLGVGLCRLMERTLMDRRIALANTEENEE